jgi:hypothetical protein
MQQESLIRSGRKRGPDAEMSKRQAPTERGSEFACGGSDPQRRNEWYGWCRFRQTNKTCCEAKCLRKRPQ